MECGELGRLSTTGEFAFDFGGCPFCGPLYVRDQSSVQFGRKKPISQINLFVRVKASLSTRQDA
jgi:hypothetical protein